MMQVVPKWRVTVKFDARNDVVVWISEWHASNVLRQIAALDFTNSTEGPIAIAIELQK